MGHRHQLTARALRAALGELARGITGQGSPLEVSLPAEQGARTRSATLLHDRSLRAHPVPAPVAAAGESPGFDAFLDGVQESRVVAYAGVIPIVHGRTAAVVRARVQRRLVTWGEGARTEDALYVPVAAIPASLLEALAGTGCAVVDTSDASIDAEEAHPQQWLRRAVHLVQRGREALERALADAWCAAPGEAMLYVDGGLPSSEIVLQSARAVGLIKSHHTLYATGAALAAVMALGARERSSVFVVETRWREPVASWYLRLRAPGGHDPLWALVRVECPLSMLAGDPREGERAADGVSQWVIAESSPLSLPDARWDTMAYGIRDCEVYLRATLGRLAP